ncbi:hypothetical protein BH24ACT15_BH24ACT15_23060 [soil metagenome]
MTQDRPLGIMIDMNATTPKPPTVPPPAPTSPPQGPAFPMPESSPPRRSRLPSGAEALGWGGGIVTLIGVAAVTADYWTSLRGWPLVTVLALATGILAFAAASVADLDHQGDDTLVTQLATTLWISAGICTSWTTYVAVDQLSGGRAYLGLLAASSAVTAMTAAAARRTDNDLYRAVALLSAAVAAFAGTALISDDGVVLGVVVGAVGAAGLVTCALVRPDATKKTQGLGLSVMLAGAEAALLIQPDPAIAGLIVAGVAASAIAVVIRSPNAIGWTSVVGAFALTLQVLNDVVPTVFTFSTGVLALGIAMTVGCIVLVRRVRRDDPDALEEDH